MMAALVEDRPGPADAATARSHPRDQSRNEMSDDQPDDHGETPVGRQRRLGMTLERENVLERSYERARGVVYFAHDRVARVGAQNEQDAADHDYQHDDSYNGPNQAGERKCHVLPHLLWDFLQVPPDWFEATRGLTDQTAAVPASREVDAAHSSSDGRRVCS
jgi:hypothetical protein